MIWHGGFTLTELLIVTVIVMIVSIIAYPAYRDYVSKTKITSSISHVEELISKVKEYYSIKGEFPLPQDINSVANWNSFWDTFHAGDYTVDSEDIIRIIYHCNDSYNCPNSAYIAIEYPDSVSGNDDAYPDQLKFLLYPSMNGDVLIMECGQQDGGLHASDLAEKFLPLGCRNNGLESLGASLS